MKKFKYINIILGLLLFTLNTNVYSNDKAIGDKAGFEKWCNQKGLTRKQKYTIKYLKKDNRVSNCKGLYDELTKYRGLTIDWPKKKGIEDITFVKFLPLKWLRINGHRIKDISPISSLQNLSYLSLRSNNISDISTLKDFKSIENLSELDLSNNKIDSIETLLMLDNIRIIANGNPIPKKECERSVFVRFIEEFCFNRKKIDKKLRKKQKSNNLTQNEFNEILSAITKEKSLITYLHPESPGRIPVKIAVSNEFKDFSITAKAFGELIKYAKYPKSADTLHLEIIRKDDLCKVYISYKLEGATGSIYLKKTSDGWKAIFSSVSD